jgi:Ca2+-transporting ATPase
MTKPPIHPGSTIERPRGLTEAEAAKRLKEEGYNELPSAKSKSAFRIAFEVVKEPMFLLLIACGIIYMVLGDIQEALILLFFVFVIIGITFYQERKTERTLEALRDLSSPRATVIRDGVEKKIAGREVVRGDYMLLNEGDRIPADAIVMSATDFSVDESLLTGESVPCRKCEGEESEEIGRPGGDDLPFIYSGTLAVKGQAAAVVKRTGLNLTAKRNSPAGEKHRHYRGRHQPVDRHYLRADQ